MAGLQLVLDRGEMKDWFGSTEIIIEATLAVSGFYLFIVLMQLGNYPVDVAGLLLAPRGIGTMLAMMVSPRIADRMDSRIIMAFGVLSADLESVATLRLDPGDQRNDADHQHDDTGRCGRPDFCAAERGGVRHPGAKLRYEATSFLTLIRSIGMSMGISIFEALVTQNTQVEHSVLAVFASPLNRAIDATRRMAHALSPMTAHGAALLNQMINYQSQVIGYIDDYRLMAILSAHTDCIVVHAQAEGWAGRRACDDGSAGIA